MLDSHPAVIVSFGDFDLFQRYKRVRQHLHDDLLPLKTKERIDQTHGLEVSGYLREGETDAGTIRILVSGLYLNRIDDAMLIIRRFFVSRFPEAAFVELRARGNPDPHILSYK